MSATNTSFYASGIASFLSGAVDWTSDDVYLALVQASYSPNLAADSAWAPVSECEAVGAGYTPGGAQLASTSINVVSVGGNWLASTAFAENQVVQAGSGLAVCVVTGTTGSVVPKWPTAQGVTVQDGTVTWAYLGKWGIALSSSAVSWNPLTVTNVRYGVIYSGERLLALIDMGSAFTLDGPWGLQPDPVTGWLFYSG